MAYQKTTSAAKHPGAEVDAREMAIQRLCEVRTARQIAMRELEAACEQVRDPADKAKEVADAER